MGTLHCGGSSASSDVGFDAGTDSTTGADGAPADDGASTTDAPTDGGDQSDASDSATAQDAGQDAAACGPDFTACVNASTSANDFCSAGQCNACTDTTDDPHCNAAYGTADGGVDGGASEFICVGGACVQGNCHATPDCAATHALCQNNTCSPCAGDTDCKNDPAYGAGYVCSQGACVSSTCATPSKACDGSNSNPNFPGDECCPTGVGGANACVAGTCCQDADCGSATLQCSGHQCVPKSCTLPGSSYWVDPHNGSDTNATGSAACPFKTIKQALLAMGAPSSATTITVIKNDPVSTATGEIFPISVPANVLVKGQFGGAGAPSVYIPSGKPGFSLSKPNSGLQALVIDGSGGTGTVGGTVGQIGVVVTSGSDSTTTTLQGAVVEYMNGPGIVVSNASSQPAAGLHVGPAVQSIHNGTATTPQSGLVVGGSAVVNIASSTDAISFSSNTQHGIVVGANGSVNITGVPSNAQSGTVIANNNVRAGLFVSQTPGTSVAPNTVSGLVVFGTTNGNGIRITGGSNVKLSGSFSTSNVGSGIDIASFGAGSTSVDDLSKIDLGGGAHGSAGGNTFQTPNGSNPNGLSGICLEITPNKSQTLNAKDNKFASTTKTAAVDCATAAAGTKVSTNASNSCGGQVSVGGSGTTGNTVAIDNCAFP